MKNENIEKIEYERPRCKTLIELPFGIFIARRIRVEPEKDKSLDSRVNPLP
jgi:hypothetical protein